MMTFSDSFKISSMQDLIDLINEVGFVPFFRNEIDDFSIEDHISYKCWYNSGDDGKLRPLETKKNARFRAMFLFENIVLRQYLCYMALVKKTGLMYAADSHSKTSVFSKSF